MSARCLFTLLLGQRMAACFVYLWLVLLLTGSSCLYAQVVRQPPDIRITDVRLVEGEQLQIDYQEGDQAGSRRVPVAVLADLIRQMQKKSPTSPENTESALGTSLGTAETPGARSRKRGNLSVSSPVTGLTYKAHLIADSLVQVRYETEAGTQRADLPVHVLTFLYRAHNALTEKSAPEVTEAYINFKTWSLWFNIAQRYDFRIVLAFFVLGIVGLVFLPFRFWVKRVERERDAIAASRRRLVEAREAERSHLAAELHDGPIQTLQQTLRTVPLSAALREEEIHARLDHVQQTLEQVTGELRNLCTELRPPVLVHFGLDRALRSYVQVFLKRHGDLEVHLDLATEKKTLPFPIRLALFRIGQEALTNVGKHAEARHVHVTFQLEQEQILLAIQDDGCGFTPPRRWIELEEAGHLGLSGIAERAEAIGGRLEVESVPGQGTVLRVVAPRPPASVQESDAEIA